MVYLKVRLEYKQCVWINFRYLLRLQPNLDMYVRQWYNGGDKIMVQWCVYW